MNQFRQFSELKKAHGDIYGYLSGVLEEMTVSEDVTTFDASLGGDIFVVETIEDLQAIESHAVRGGDLCIDKLSDTACVFDICEWVLDGKFLEIFIATNNSGGPTYYIPREIALASPTVMQSIELTKENAAEDSGNDEIAGN